MMKHEEIHFSLEDGPEQDFTSAKLQIRGDGPSVPSNTTASKININDNDVLLNGNLLDKSDIPLEKEEESLINDATKVRPTSLAVVPWSGENARDFFSYRDGLVTNAVQECIKELLTSEDGDYSGSWLLTEISFWDHERERLLLLTSKYLTIIKYDFIALKQLEHRKISLDLIDTVNIGELSYPTASLIPHLDGLATGVSGVFKDCLVRPIQEKWAGMPPCTSSSPFRVNNFEARSRKMSGVRVMWNNGEPLPFIKKWNPFEKEIPFTTFTSHPLLWHKDETDSERRMYNVDDFTTCLTNCLERKQRNFQCTIQHKPILLENYIGLSSLIHNKNSLGFFKVRGKFSF